MSTGFVIAKIGIFLLILLFDIKCRIVKLLAIGCHKQHF